MNNQTQAVINTLIGALECREKIARKDLKKYIEKCGSDRFSAGRINEIMFFWNCLPSKPGSDGKASTKISFMIDTSGGSLDYGIRKEKFDTDFSFITEDIFEKDIAPALEAWLHEKVCNEEWGGLYDAKTRIATSDHITTKSIVAIDEKRLEHRIQLVRDFIVKKEYETEDLKKIRSSLNDILRIAATYLYDELGVDALTTFYGKLLDRARGWKDPDLSQGWMMMQVAEALTRAAYALTNPKGQWQVTEEKSSLACRLCMDVMLHADEYRKDDAREALEAIAQRGSKEAKNILKFGSGLIAPEIVQYKDNLVSCNANDVTKIIDLKLKEESEGAYNVMLDYIIRLMNADFPRDYSIKLNSKEKNFIPKLLKTKTQLFWNNCANYPALWSKMKEYVTMVIGKDRYYSDASDEAAVLSGGYATFALGMASADNCDIMKIFMEQNDSEHSLSPDVFIFAYLEKYGVNPQNAEAVLVSIINMNEPHTSPVYEYKKKIAGLDQPETMAAIADAMVKLEFDDYHAQIVVNFLFGKANKPETLIKNSSGKVKQHLEQILAMAECGKPT
ncbi:MAG: DUF6138 family protein [Azoarcus sp.]|jgi:hypothetical protein|nr:DUF6138 family protein [Azoarcus sp.]